MRRSWLRILLVIGIQELKVSILLDDIVRRYAVTSLVICEIDVIEIICELACERIEVSELCAVLQIEIAY